jgi:hypothetical protein
MYPTYLDLGANGNHAVWSPGITSGLPTIRPEPGFTSTGLIRRRGRVSQGTPVSLNLAITPVLPTGMQRPTTVVE